MSGGKVAYIYMPDTANGGLTSFNRYFLTPRSASRPRLSTSGSTPGGLLGNRCRGDPESRKAS
jgi:hypothetical protein